MLVQKYEFYAKRENIFGIICFSVNFLATQQRKMYFSLFSLLEHLQKSERRPSLAERERLAEEENVACEKG